MCMPKAEIATPYTTAKTMLEMMQVMPQNKIYMHKEDQKQENQRPYYNT